MADWDTPDGQYFEVTENGATVKHRPKVVDVSSQPKGILTEDVALFARAVSPFNRKRTVTICNGMYGRGTHGVVRALTDARFRDRNADYLRSRFGSSDTFCILSRILRLTCHISTPGERELSMAGGVPADVGAS